MSEAIKQVVVIVEGADGYYTSSTIGEVYRIFLKQFAKKPNNVVVISTKVVRVDNAEQSLTLQSAYSVSEKAVIKLNENLDKHYVLVQNKIAFSIKKPFQNLSGIATIQLKDRYDVLVKSVNLVHQSYNNGRKFKAVVDTLIGWFPEIFNAEKYDKSILSKPKIQNPLSLTERIYNFAIAFNFYTSKLRDEYRAKGEYLVEAANSFLTVALDLTILEKALKKYSTTHNYEKLAGVLFSYFYDVIKNNKTVNTKTKIFAKYYKADKEDLLEQVIDKRLSEVTVAEHFSNLIVSSALELKSKKEDISEIIGQSDFLWLGEYEGVLLLLDSKNVLSYYSTFEGVADVNVHLSGNGTFWIEAKNMNDSILNKVLKVMPALVKHFHDENMNINLTTKATLSPL